MLQVQSCVNVKLLCYYIFDPVISVDQSNICACYPYFMGKSFSAAFLISLLVEVWNIEIGNTELKYARRFHS